MRKPNLEADKVPTNKCKLLFLATTLLFSSLISCCVTDNDGPTAGIDTQEQSFDFNRPEFIRDQIESKLPGNELFDRNGRPLFTMYNIVGNVISPVSVGDYFGTQVLIKLVDDGGVKRITLTENDEYDYVITDVEAQENPANTGP